MPNLEIDSTLAIDEDFAPIFTLDEAQELKPIIKEFLVSYAEHRDSMPVDQWLQEEISKQLPDRSSEEISDISSEIVTVIHQQEETKASLEHAVASGKSAESWFASEVAAATSHMETQAAAQYLQGLDDAVKSANDALHSTIYTQGGVVSQNPNLDGFIAEQYHAQTFNMNAEAAGSPYRAKVLEPNGSTYKKNSVDIVIVDDQGKIVRRYQSKYCKNAESTSEAFEHGDYRGQRKLVPEGQAEDISKKTSTVLEAPDGTKSTPLTKEEAKNLQEEAQSGKWTDLDWNEYTVKDIAKGVAKQAGQAALFGAAIGAGFNVAQKVWDGEEIDGEELIETALISGADSGIKAAVAGALKVASEKEIIRTISKGTPAGTIADIAHVAVEEAKVAVKVVTGELTAKEGLAEVANTGVSTVAGIAAAAKGSAIGATIGKVLGAPGAFVGSFVGGTIGYMAGSTVGQAVIHGAKELGKSAVQGLRNAGRTVSNGLKSAAEALKHPFRRRVFG